MPQRPLASEPDDREPVFCRALADLYEHAGRPTYAELIRQAAAQRPPMKVTDSSLSDWLAGVSVPSSPRIVAFLVSYLQGKAARNGHQARPQLWWEDQRARAQRARRAGRGGRPRTPSGDDGSPLGRAAAEAQRLGWPSAQVDPIALEVHPAIDAGAAAAGLGALPAYLPRAHDEALAAIVAEARGGASRIVVLVGGSSTGKTRALWEAVRELEEPWRLWHPIDPGRPQAALTDLRQAGSHTVIWLNEAQHYLLTGDHIGEQVAAGLRDLLRTPERGPVLVVGTLWPEYAAILSAVPSPGEPDPHAQARDLLKGAELRVPEAFTGPELETAVRIANANGDPRWAEALRQARAGAVTQYLAGGPALIGRYQRASAEARAVLHAAMDARRLGHRVALPRLLLEQAAAGYLSEDQWDLLGDDWLEQAFAYLTDPRPCRGALPPLTRIRPRPGSGNTRPQGEEPSYRLADYLEQHGTRTRHLICPPAEFWDAATRHAATPADHSALAHAAYDRDRRRHAYNLWQHPADAGDTEALLYLAEIRERAGDQEEAQRLYRAAANAGDTEALLYLAEIRERAGDQEEAQRLYQAAANAGDTGALWRLAMMQERAGHREEAERLAHAAANAGSTFGLENLARMRERAGDREEAERLAHAAADAGDSRALQHLAEIREQAGDQEGAERLYHAAANAGNTEALWHLAEMREQAGDREGAERLYHAAADTWALWRLAEMREQAGDQEEAQRLYQAAANAATDAGDTWMLPYLAEIREQAGDLEEAERLYRAAVNANDIRTLQHLVELRERAGDLKEAERLAHAAAADAGDSRALQHLAEIREQAGDREGAERLYHAAAKAAADAGDTWALQHLAEIREQAGDREEAERLAHAATNAGNAEALWDLAKNRHRLGVDGRWSHLLRFGLEADGRVADPW